MSKWTDAYNDPYDTGNGALAYIEKNAAYPGIERVRIIYYATGRGPDYTYYRWAAAGAGAHVRAGYCGYDTLKAALADKQFHQGRGR